MLLFTTLFLIFVAVIAVFLLVLDALDHLFQWSMVTLAFVKAYRSPGQFRREARFTTWLTRIARKQS